MATAALHDGKQQLKSDEWTDHVEELLEREELLEVRKATTRVPMAMVNDKADAYIPQILSLGPHHHLALKVASCGLFELPPTHISQMDMYKLKFAREAAGRKPNVIKQVATELTKPPSIKKFEDFYDWRIGGNARELKNFSFMMAVDAFFLFQFLKKYFYDENCMPFISSVRCDILKLENQIPLFLLLKVRDAVPPEPQQFDLQSRIKSLSSFQVRRTAVKILEGEEHLLGCIHKYVSSFLQIQTAEVDKRRPSGRQRISNKMGSVAGPVGTILGRNASTSEGQHELEGQHEPEGQRISSKMGCLAAPIGRLCGRNPATFEGQHEAEGQGMSSKMESAAGPVGSLLGRNPATPEGQHDPQGQHDFLNRYSAENLLKAGISFKPLPDDPSSKIRFDKISRTLYLPKIEVVGSYTEVVLRNLLALELNEPSRQKAVSNYVTLMDSLIDSPKDVRVLRVRGVIICRGMMISDNYVAEMWNGLCKPLLGCVMEAPHALQSQINQLLIENFCKTRFKTLSWEFSKLYLSKPWNVVGLLVRIFLVLVVEFMFVGQYNLGWPKFNLNCPRKP